MKLEEARQIGATKLNIDERLFRKAKEAAEQMGVEPKHMGPMTLALALMGVAKAHDPSELSGEMTDALALVSRAEDEWRMDISAAISRAAKLK